MPHLTGARCERGVRAVFSLCVMLSTTASSAAEAMAPVPDGQDDLDKPDALDNMLSAREAFTLDWSRVKSAARPRMWTRVSVQVTAATNQGLTTSMRCLGSPHRNALRRYSRLDTTLSSDAHTVESWRDSYIELEAARTPIERAESVCTDWRDGKRVLAFHPLVLVQPLLLYGDSFAFDEPYPVAHRVRRSGSEDKYDIAAVAYTGRLREAVDEDDAAVRQVVIEIDANNGDVLAVEEYADERAENLLRRIWAHGRGGDFKPDGFEDSSHPWEYYWVEYGAKQLDKGRIVVRPGR